MARIEDGGRRHEWRLDRASRVYPRSGEDEDNEFKVENAEAGDDEATLPHDKTLEHAGICDEKSMLKPKPKPMLKQRLMILVSSDALFLSPHTLPLSFLT